MAADRRQSKKGQASGNKLLAVTATPLPSSLLHQTLTRSDERRTRMANPRDVNNLLHDLHDKQIVNLDTTLRATLHPRYPASSHLRAHPHAVGRFPGGGGYTAYPAAPILRRDEEGFARCRTCPGHRAVAHTPPASELWFPSACDSSYGASGSCPGGTVSD